MLLRMLSWASRSVWKSLLMGLLIEAGLELGYRLSIGFGPTNPLDPRGLAYGVTQLPSSFLYSIFWPSYDSRFANICIVAGQLLIQATFFGLLIYFLMPDRAETGGERMKRGSDGD